MPTRKKFVTGAQRLCAALLETDPASADLILIRPAGFRAAFRLAPLADAPVAARCPRAAAAMRPAHGPVPAWRRRFAIPHPPAVLPV